MRSSIRLHQVLLAAAVIVPMLLFGAAAWQNREDVRREGRDAIQRTAAVMQEHAHKVFETAELAIGQVDERIDGASPADVRSPATSDFLRRLKGSMDQLVSIWIADQNGTIEAGTQPWAPGGIGMRDWFKRQQEVNAGTHVGAVFTGNATQVASFAIIRRRSAPDGRFIGTIHVSASPDYFARFYAEAAPPFPHTALLVRSDGTVLAHEPPDAAAPERLAANTPVMRRIADPTLPDGSLQQDAASGGIVQEYAIRQVGAYPVYVVFSVAEPVMLARWYRNLRVYGVVAAGAALTLLIVSWLALRRAQSEQLTLGRLQAEIAQRQAAEQQLRHAQRMDAVGQLTGGVAHDFNNLLTAILGNLELIQRAAAMPDAQEKICRLAATAMKAVQRGSGLTKSLLAFSRKQPLQPRPIDANAQLQDSIELIRQAVGVGIRVEFAPDPGLPACIADPAELEAALLNLAINARDAMPGGGNLVIATHTAALTAEALAGNPEARPGRFVAVRVTDSGTGMTAEIAAKAFEPFFTTKPVGQGTGLGLSQVFGFARQLGGHVTIESHPGQGTSICLFLPVVAAEATA